MRRRRKRISEDINLTPLLDVLFVILFIFMLTSTQSEKLLQTEAADSQSQVEDMSQQIAGLEAQVDDLKHENNILESRREAAEHVVIVNIENTVEDGKHILKFYKGSEGVYYDQIIMGRNLQEHIKKNVTSIITRIIEEESENTYPICIFFHCDYSRIYQNEEFMPIDETLRELESDEKKVFYQLDKK